MIPGVCKSGWDRTRQIAKEYGFPYALGTHPFFLGEELLPEEMGEALAVGECGLDKGAPFSMEMQEKALRIQLERAKELGLPVILHAVRCHDRLPMILRHYAPIRGVLHGYSGGEGMVEVYQRMGLFFSFGGAILRGGARKPLEAIRAIRLDRLLVETDAPDQSWRPGRCEPSFLGEIVEAMEKIKEVPLSEVLHQNGHDLFGPRFSLHKIR